MLCTVHDNLYFDYIYPEV